MYSIVRFQVAVEDDRVAISTADHDVGRVHDDGFVVDARMHQYERAFVGGVYCLLDRLVILGNVERPRFLLRDFTHLRRRPFHVTDNHRADHALVGRAVQ